MRGRVRSWRPSARRPPEFRSPGSRGCGPESGAPFARPHPWGSRIGDVTSDRIAPDGLARIERRRIMSRWARTARGEVDCVALSSHCASRARPSPVRPASAPVALELGAHRPGPGPRLPGPRQCGVGRTDPVAVVDPVPVPFHPAPAGSARSSLNPRARTSSRRSRGLSDDLADRAASDRGVTVRDGGKRWPVRDFRVRGGSCAHGERRHCAASGREGCGAGVKDTRRPPFPAMNSPGAPTPTSGATYH